MEEVRERRTVTVSPANHLSVDDLKKWAMNALWHTAPALILFFGQLQAGVEPKAAAGVALLALYGLIADLLKKWKNESVTL